MSKTFPDGAIHYLRYLIDLHDVDSLAARKLEIAPIRLLNKAQTGGALVYHACFKILPRKSYSFKKLNKSVHFLLKEAKIGKRLFVDVNIFWLALTFSWQALIVVFLPTEILSYVSPGYKGTALAIIFSTGALLSSIVQPLAGTLSDYSTHRWGRRRPFFAAGTLLFLVGLVFLHLFQSLSGLFFSVILLFLAVNLAQAPYQALFADLIPHAARGKAAGYMGISNILGTTVGPLSVGYLVGSGYRGSALLIIALLLIALGIYTLVAVKETQAENHLEFKQKWPKMWDFKFSQYPGFYRFLAARFFQLLALTTIVSILLFFLKDVVGVENPAEAVGWIMAAAMISALLSIYPAASLSDHYGRKPPLYFGGFVAAIGLILLATATTFAQAIIASVVIGAAFGCFAGSEWAFTMDLIPEDHAGRFLGYTHFTTSAAHVLAPAVAGPLIDRVAAPTGYQFVFAITFLYLLVGFIVLLATPETRPRDKD